MDGWGALKMLMNRQEGNRQRMRELKETRDKKIKNGTYSSKELEFPKPSKSLLETIRIKTQNSTRKQRLVYWFSVVVVFLCILLFFLQVATS
jgi:hypothetical protein